MPAELKQRLAAPLTLSTPRQRLTILALLILIAVIYFAFYIRAFPDAPYVRGDTHGYQEVAQAIQNHDFSQLWDRVPGYSVLLILTGAATTPTRTLFIAQLALHLLASLLIAFSLDRLRVPAWLLGVFLVIALLPSQVEPAIYVLSENLTQALLALAVTGFCLWLTRRSLAWLAVAGLALAVSGLVRPSNVTLIPVIIVFVLALAVLRWIRISRRRLALSLTLLIVPWLLIDATYVLSNQIRFHYFGISPLMGISLTIRTAGFVEFLPHKYDNVRQILIDARNADYETSDSRLAGDLYIYDAMPALEQVTGLDRAGLAQFLQKMNFDLIVAQPIKYIRAVLSSATDFWIPELNQATFNFAPLTFVWSLLLLLGFAIFWGSLILFALLGWIRLFFVRLWDALFRRRGQPSAALLTLALLWLIIFYNFLISITVDIGVPRHRKPTDLLIVFAAVLSVAILLRLRQRLDTLLATAADPRS